MNHWPTATFMPSRQRRFACSARAVGVGLRGSLVDGFGLCFSVRPSGRVWYLSRAGFLVRASLLPAGRVLNRLRSCWLHRLTLRSSGTRRKRRAPELER